jgi:hypothetical protein
MTHPDEDASIRERLLEVLNRLRQQLAAGDHNSVRPAVYSGRWAEGAEADEGAERDLIAAAIQKTDDAHTALSRWPPDMPTAERALDEAIQALGSGSS